MNDPRSADKYMGARIVTAVSCDRESYANSFAESKTFVAREDDNKPGYLVEVHEGTENHPDYKGRIHWVEKQEFECCYAKIPELLVYNKLLHTLHIEQVQLLVRIKEAVDYTRTPSFLKLTSIGRELALEQVRVMTRYSAILDARIEGSTPIA